MTVPSDDFQDFPYSGERRPFDWVREEPPLDIPIHGYVTQETDDDAISDLVLCLHLYIVNRRQYYINYLRIGKVLFGIFFREAPESLRERSRYWEPGMTEHLSKGNLGLWLPGYEIQRLWVITGIHWSWLEWAWIQVQDRMIKSDHWAMDELIGNNPVPTLSHLRAKLWDSKRNH